MEEKISFLVPKDLCEGCIVTRCKKMLNDKTQCYLNRKPYALVGNKVPNNIEDVKEILDKAKIKHELFYVNDKDYKWTINDKVKILRAIVIRFKTKFDDVYTEYSVTIDNDNRIVIHKYKYEGSESITMELSTMEQIWNMFANIYKDVLGEK